MKKRIFSLLLVVAMLVGMLPMNVFATEGDGNTTVAEVNGNKYESLQAAIDAATAGQTVTLLADITVNDESKTSGYYFTVGPEDDITLALNGHSISGTINGTKNCGLINVQGKLKVTGNGTIQLTNTDNSTSWGFTSAVIGLNNHDGYTVDTTLTLGEGVTVKHNGGTAMAFAVDMMTYTGCTVNINGATLESTYTAVRIFGNNGNKVLNITSGTIKGTSRGVWAQNNGSADVDLNVSGGDISGGRGIHVSVEKSATTAANVELTGGKVSSVTLALAEEASAVPVITKAGTVDVAAPEGYEWNNEGKLVETPAATLNPTLNKAYVSWRNATNLQIWGEVYNLGGVYLDEFKVNFYDASNALIATTTLAQKFTCEGSLSWHLRVTGASDTEWWTYNWVEGNPSPDKVPATAEFIINGKNCGSVAVVMYHETEAHEDNWADYFKASVNGTYYFSLQNAIDAAASGNTVKLLANVTELGTEVEAGSGEYFVKILDKDVTIDLNGKTFTGSFYLNSGAKLTIDNGFIVSHKDNLSSCIESVGGTLVLGEDLNAHSNTRHTIRVKGGTATINGGTYKATGNSTYHVVNISNASTVTINGGTFIGAKDYSTSGNAVMIQDADSEVTINGGTFKNAAGPEGCICAAEGLTIKGGAFDTWTYDNYLDDGYVAVLHDDDNLYHVEKFTNWLQVADTSWYKEGTTSFTITTAEQLAGLAKLVNNGTAFAGVTVTLGNDIDLSGAHGVSGIVWPGIGVYNKTDVGTAFQGTFDGDNHKITNVTFADNTGASYAAGDPNNYRGLFNQIANATVKNLTVSGNGFGTTVPSGEYGGAMIVGHAYCSTVENCVSDGTFTGTHNVAGIVVRTTDAIITGCTNRATLSGSYTKMAGIVCVNENCVTGTAITNCVNEGAITSTANGANGVAGILGWSYTGGKLTITGCENKGAITGTDTARIAQIAGMVYTSNNTISGNKGLATTLAVNHQYAVADLNYAIVENGVATYVKDADLEAGKTYLVTGNNAKPVIVLKSGESISFDTSLASIDATGITAEKALSVATSENGKVITYTVSTAVAEINGVKYATLADAIAAAKDGDTVKLLADVELEAKDGTSGKLTRLITIDKDITLNLNGKTISLAEKASVTGIPAILNITGTVTITGNGTIDGELGGNAVYAINVDSNGDLTIEDGTFKGGATAVQANGGKLTIKGGTFELTDTYKGYYPNGTTFLINCIDDSGSTVTISGGNFWMYNPADNNAEGEYTGFAPGMVGVYNAETGYYTLVKGTYVARTGGTQYTSLADAIAAAKDGATVELLADVALTAPIDVDKAVTLNLGAFSITPAEGYAKDYLIGVKYGGNLTIEGTGSISNNGNAKVYTAVKMTLTGETYAEGNKATLTVKGGTLEGEYYGIAGNGYRHGTVITISGGTVKGAEGFGIYQPQNGTLTVTGGTVTGLTGIYVKAGTVSISGGEIKATGAKAEYKYNANGAEPTGDAIVVDNCDYPGQTPVVTISGGTFTVAANGGVQVGAYAGNGVETIATITSTNTDLSAPEGYEWNDEGKLVEKVEEPELIEFYGTNVDLLNSLQMNFYISKTNLPIASDYYALVTITHADERGTVTKKIGGAEWILNGNYHQISFDGIAAKEMADTVTIQIFKASDDSAVSVKREESVRDYAMRTLANEKTLPSVKTVIVDMLNYGAAAQTYFVYNTEDLANNKLTDEQKDLATKSVEMTDKRSKGDNFYGSNVDLKSSIMLNLYFNKSANSDGMYAIVKYTDHNGNSKESRIESADFVLNGNYYQITVSTLRVADVYQLVECVIYNKDGTVYGGVTDSIESYLARSNIDINVAAAKFTASAYSYFH